MEINKSIENLVTHNIPLDPPSNNGWRKVLCKVCNDHGKKGKRAAFKFDPGGVVTYNCFNCSHAAVDNPADNRQVSKKMVTVLNAFGISDLDIKRVGLARLDSPENKNKVKAEKRAYAKLIPKTIKALPFFYPLAFAEPDDAVALQAIEYLKNERFIDPESHIFLLSKPVMPDDSATLKVVKSKWVNRLIIPVFFNDDLIFWQGRDLTNKMPDKYENPAVEKALVLYGFDKILDKNHSDEPLYIVEGIFDAMLINGIAILGNKFNEEKIEWLNRSSRPKVYIPDMWGDGEHAAYTALKQGWSISIPNLPGCKDITDGFKKYGELFTLKQIHDNICNGFTAELKLKLNIR